MASTGPWAIVAPVATMMVRRPCCLMVVHLVSWRGLDEHEWVALDDGDDQGAVADQGGHALQDVAGQRAAGPAGDGDRDGLVALVVRAGAAELPAVARVEGLLAGAGGPG